MHYFYKFSELKLKKEFLKIRRFNLIGLKYKKNFEIGDILEVIVFKKNLPFIYEGICISVKKKSFIGPEVMFTIRNIILGIPIEVIYSFYYNRLYSLNRNDYKRKVLNHIKHAKLFYIRFRSRIESYVK